MLIWNYAFSEMLQVGTLYSPKQAALFNCARSNKTFCAFDTFAASPFQACKHSSCNARPKEKLKFQG